MTVYVAHNKTRHSPWSDGLTAAEDSPFCPRFFRTSFSFSTTTRVKLLLDFLRCSTGAKNASCLLVNDAELSIGAYIAYEEVRQDPLCELAAAKEHTLVDHVNAFSQSRGDLRAVAVALCTVHC